MLLAVLLVEAGAAAGSRAHTAERTGAAALPRLWAVQVGGAGGWFDQATLRTIRADGINALVVRVSAFGRAAAGTRKFNSVRKFAAAEKLYLVAMLPAGKPRTPAMRRAAADCSAHRSAKIRCAVQAGSLAAAARLARKPSRLRQVVAVYVKGPRQLSRLGGLPSRLRRRILVIAPLYTRFQAAVWATAITQTVASTSVNMAVEPLRGGSAALRQFATLLGARSSSAGGPPPPPPPPPPPASNANVWVNPSGGSCLRSATPGPYSAASACGSFQAAYSIAQCGDVVGVQPGTYSDQSISSAAKTCAAGSHVLFTSAPGGACVDDTRVSMPSFSISAAYLELQCIDANPAGTTSCEDISGSSHTSVAWITLDHVAMHCAFFDSDHLRVTNSTFGPDDTCQTNMEDLIDFRANSTNIDDVVFDHDTFETVTAPPDFECGVGNHVDSMQGYGISNLVISDSTFFGCPGQCIIFRPYDGGTPGPITIVNSIFNEPQSPGQAIDIGSDSSSDGDHCNGPILIENNDFVNGAAVHGGCWNGASVTFRNNIMSGGSCGFAGGGASYSNNVFYSGVPCGASPRICVPLYLGNVTSLILPGNFHLAPTDTCARGAASQVAGQYPATDIDGQARPQGSAVDAGADEIP